ncbi:zinc finger protein 879-like [Bradysia coprophila]|uniref:zinc finger protein 879-like n=1 Tax=Bradysia coprophila TaxID=38358 RepID=UPI00187D8F8C|nr:zinc finger protein 879-like [Bradysia coprophila]
MSKILKCCILGCNENSRNVMEEVSFHRIPKDVPTRKKWTDLIRSKTNQPNVFAINALVCSKHFEPNQLVERVNGSRLLINYAIPSIFPNEHREWFKSDGSDDDESTEPLKNVSSTMTIEPSDSSAAKAQLRTVDCSATRKNSVTVSIKQEDDCEELQATVTTDFQRSCRFCLTIPGANKIETSEHIATMYTSLTGIEFLPATFAVPETICTTCSSKLQDAFEFREHLIKMNAHWETAVKTEDTKDAIVIQMEPRTVHLEAEVLILDESDQSLDNTEVVEEFVEFGDSEDLENGDDHVDEEKQTAESDEDDRFIADAANFIKTVKQVTRSEMKRVQAGRPAGGIVLTAKKAKILAADTERLNFRSSSCPHSSQKLKKDNKWWRLMHDCNYCDAKDFLTVDAVKKHLKLHHADQVKVTCDICNKDYSELKYLRKHMKYVHQTRQNECKICNKKFYYNYNLKSHMQVHNNEKTVICHLCGKFFTPAALHGHMKTGVHGPVEKSVKEQNSKIARYYCHICVPAKRFHLCSELTEHRRLQHNDFECPICKNWFSCAESLENHLKTHSNKERKHCCTRCPSTYVRASHLEGHMRRKHSSDPKPISCDLCDYKCVEQYELYGHKKHAHSKSKPYKCNLCDKSFSKDQAQKDHLLTTHGIGEYRYSCSECPKRFTNSAGLIHHRGIHHRGVANKIS